ncbi:MAG: nucleotide sugar dehydrogenase [Candidatus Omnitrophica bacterium]|nr:nucleotide sugar dehydrogenase [Candidatus Omnitrophota bacterium]
MGFPLAVQAASRGFNVTGVDTNKSVIDLINKGKCPVDEPFVKDLAKDLILNGHLSASMDLEGSVALSDAVIVIVPVLLDEDNEADVKNAVSVAEGIGRSARKGTVISFEMTLPVGTMRNVIAPILEKSGLRIEKDIYLVYSPERVKSGIVMKQMRCVPKVVGAFGPKSLRKGIELYRSIFPSKIISVNTLENAEMVKLVGMIYRDVNIALSNEIARYCEKVGIDLDTLIPIINTDGEANMLMPGIGVGGHCTPIYPYFMINDAYRRKAPQLLATLAREINDSQAEYVTHKLYSELGSIKGANIMLMGLGFRPNVKEDTKSPAYLVKSSVERYGGRVFLHDPLYSHKELEKKGFNPIDLRSTRRLDAVVLITAHKEFARMNWQLLKKKGVKVFVDGRNNFMPDEVTKHGIKYIGIGRGLCK